MLLSHMYIAALNPPLGARMAYRRDSWTIDLVQSVWVISCSTLVLTLSSLTTAYWDQGADKLAFSWTKAAYRWSIGKSNRCKLQSKIVGAHADTSESSSEGGRLVDPAWLCAMSKQYTHETCTLLDKRSTR